MPASDARPSYDDLGAVVREIAAKNDEALFAVCGADECPFCGAPIHLYGDDAVGYEGMGITHTAACPIRHAREIVAQLPPEGGG